MVEFSAQLFLITVALVGLVILVAALLSGLVERTDIPSIAVFLGLGAVLGPASLGLIDVQLDTPILRIVATLSLVLVLFTDALTVNLQEVQRHRTLALLMLGPGTLLTAGLIALVAWLLLDLSPALAIILGAALASTDPVLLRGMLRSSDMPSGARLALRLESGMNDVALLPIVLVVMAFLVSETGLGALAVGSMGLNLFILGPLAGVLIGFVSVALMDQARKRFGMRRDYESLYVLGVAFTAFAAAEALGGSGFLAAFAAGLMIASLDVELCDCFLEYGETTAEMMLLFTFVLFGSSLIWSGFGAISFATLLFAAFVLLVRLPVLYVALAGMGMSARGRLAIGWFGPRGLSALLLVLLPIFAGVPGSVQLFPIACMVVLLSIVLHGGTPLLTRRRRKQPAQVAVPAPAPQADIPLQTEVAPQPDASQTAPERESAPVLIPLEATNGNAAQPEVPPDAERMTIDELRALWERGEQVILLDVRTERSYLSSDLQARDAVRLLPSSVVRRAEELNLPKPAWLLAYCT